MLNYYRGTIRRHAAFWAHYHGLADAERFPAFMNFFEEVKREVADGKCSLRDAGFALKPACYDPIIYVPREADLTFLQDAVEDLIVEAAADPAQAKQTWTYIVSLLGPYE